jgi:hypothetical protein
VTESEGAEIFFTPCKVTRHEVIIHQQSDNFDAKLQQMTNERKHLERMGYTLSRDIVNILLQSPHY